MALIVCPKCGNSVSDKAEKCPKCNSSIIYIKYGKEIELVKKVLKIMLCILPIVIIGWIIYLKINTCTFGHIWNENVSCNQYITCSKCGETKGAPLQHEWKEATCTEPQICKRCGATEGTALGHTTLKGYCERCGQQIDEMQDIHDEIQEKIDAAYESIQEIEKIIASIDDEKMQSVIKINEINCKIQDTLYEESFVAIKYQKFARTGGYLKDASEKIIVYQDLTTESDIDVDAYINEVIESINECKESLDSAQSALKRDY